MPTMCFDIGECRLYNVHDARYNITRGAIEGNECRIAHLATARLHLLSSSYGVWITFFPMEPRHG